MLKNKNKYKFLDKFCIQFYFYELIIIKNSQLYKYYHFFITNKKHYINLFLSIK